MSDESATAVRIAAHALTNACTALVGGVPMALHLTFDQIIAEPPPRRIRNARRALDRVAGIP